MAAERLKKSFYIRKLRKFSSAMVKISRKGIIFPNIIENQRKKGFFSLKNSFDKKKGDYFSQKQWRYQEKQINFLKNGDKNKKKKYFPQNNRKRRLFFFKKVTMKWRGLISSKMLNLTGKSYNEIKGVIFLKSSKK